MKPGQVASSLLILLALTRAPALAAPAEAPQVVAARASADASLRTQVSGIQLRPGLTVGDYLNQTAATDALTDLQAKAHALGGPRWIDDQTVQVKLELSGSELVMQLVSIAATHPDGPVTPGFLEKRLRGLREISFIGTGTSMNAPSLRPPGVGAAWDKVPEPDRDQALVHARQDAEGKLLNDVSKVRIGSRTIGDLLKPGDVFRMIQGKLAALTRSDVQYSDDLDVQVTLSASKGELVDTIIHVAKLAGEDVESEQVSFAHDELTAVGHAAAGEPAGVAPDANALPDQPPTWTAEPIDAQGFAAPQRTALKTKAAAEADATETLRSEIRALRLDRERTVGDAAKSDPRIESAISSALLRAHVYKSESRADGSWRVGITLDARDLWDELSHAAGR